MYLHFERAFSAQEPEGLKATSGSPYPRAVFLCAGGLQIPAIRNGQTGAFEHRQMTVLEFSEGSCDCFARPANKLSNFRLLYLCARLAALNSVSEESPNALKIPA